MRVGAVHGRRYRNHGQAMHGLGNAKSYRNGDPAGIPNQLSNQPKMKEEIITRHKISGNVFSRSGAPEKSF